MNKLIHLSQEERRAIEQTFLQLKPVCDRIALSPTERNVEELKSVLENLHSERMELFDHYVLMPIFIHLSNGRKHNSNLVCALLECLQTVLSRTRITDINLFLKVYVLVFGLVMDEKGSDRLSSSPEELKLNVVQCARTLIRKSSEEVLSKFYTRQHYGKLSMGVYACTRIACNERNITLRVETLKAMMYLIQVQNETHSSEEFRRQMADIVMLMLPGLVSHCLGIATATDIQNHKIMMLAIRLWSRAVGLVLEDNLKDDNSNNLVFTLVKKAVSDSEDPVIDWSGNQAKTKETIQRITRCRSWVENSNKKLMPVTKAFSGLNCHQHWKVRLELVSAAKQILSSASKNMSLSVPYLIETLIILSLDEQLEISSASADAIKIFSNKCDHSEGVKSLIEIVEESMYETITRLPRILRGVGQENDVDE